jgi:hypothetical protein
VPRHFGHGPRPHHDDCPLHRHGLSARGAYSHFEPSRLDGPCFPHRGSCPTRSNGEVQRIVKTSSDGMVKCWIPKTFLTNPSTEPSTFSQLYVGDEWRPGEQVAHGFRLLMTHDQK